jgi:hypothetical protein
MCSRGQCGCGGCVLQARSQADWPTHSRTHRGTDLQHTTAWRKIGGGPAATIHRSISHPVSRRKSGGDAAYLLAVAERIACTDASRLDASRAHGHHLRPSTHCSALSDPRRASRPSHFSRHAKPYPRTLEEWTPQGCPGATRSGWAMWDGGAYRGARGHMTARY